LLIESLKLVVLPEAQISSPIDGSVVRYLNDPRYSGRLPRIVLLRALKDVKKDFLPKVVCFRFVPKDSPGDIEDYRAVSTEQKAKGILRTLPDSLQQFFIGA
jgi:hypothetical protein